MLGSLRNQKIRTYLNMIRKIWKYFPYHVEIKEFKLLIPLTFFYLNITIQSYNYTEIQIFNII